MSKALLYDNTLCIGCKQCEQACADKNKLKYDEAVAAEDKQSDHKFTVVLTKGDKFMRRLCMNCLDPPVLPFVQSAPSTRPPQARSFTKKTAAWAAAIAWSPARLAFRKYEWNKVLPRVQKCTMCPDRVSAGLPTACAEACPTGATKFGDRDELIAEARKTAARKSRQVRKPHLWPDGSRRHIGTPVVRSAL